MKTRRSEGLSSRRDKREPLARSLGAGQSVDSEGPGVSDFAAERYTRSKQKVASDTGKGGHLDDMCRRLITPLAGLRLPVQFNRAICSLSLFGQRFRVIVSTI